MAAAYYANNTDRISHLPPRIIDEILCLLPLRDAVRTSILSRTWRYKWTTMPDLNFVSVPDHLRYTQLALRMITQSLLRYRGSIRKFSLWQCLVLKEDLYYWMSFISRHPVEELRFDFSIPDVGIEPNFCIPDVRIPSFLFNCKKLTHLELHHCKLDIPCKFEGFLNLKTLLLEDVEVTGNIEMIVSTSPLLENLSLLISGLHVEVITISAPKLKYFNFENLGMYWDYIVTEDTQLLIISAPDLLDLKVSHKVKYIFLNNIIPDRVMNDDQRDSKLLRGTGYFNQMRAPQTRFYHVIKTMDLSPVNFEDWEEVVHLMVMLTSAPNLEKLVIRAIDPDATSSRVAPDFWPNEQSWNGQLFMKLKVFRIETSGVPDQIEFVKLMLCNSPILEKMDCIISRRETGDDVQTLEACTRATVTFTFDSLLYG